MVYNNLATFLPLVSSSTNKEPLFFITIGFFSIESLFGLFLGFTYKSYFIISDKPLLYLVGIGSYIPC